VLRAGGRLPAAGFGTYGPLLLTLALNAFAVLALGLFVIVALIVFGIIFLILWVVACSLFLAVWWEEGREQRW
jgi:hypothetical protein